MNQDDILNKIEEISKLSQKTLEQAALNNALLRNNRWGWFLMKGIGESSQVIVRIDRETGDTWVNSNFAWIKLEEDKSKRSTEKPS